MNTLRIKILVAALAGLSGAIHAQDVHFSQFTETPLVMDPSQTGMFQGLVRATGAYRSQWAGLDKGFNTMFISADMKFSEGARRTQGNRYAFGLTIFRDKGGMLGFGRTSIMGSFGYHIENKDGHTLSFGMAAGYVQTFIDRSALEWGSQYNGLAYDPNLPGENLGYTPTGFPDFSAGVSWSFGTDAATLSSADSKKGTIGISAQHLTNPLQSSWPGSTDQLPLRYTLHGKFFSGTKNKNISVEGSFLAMMQGPALEFAAGMHAYFEVQESSRYTGYVQGKFAGFGIVYRYNDAIAPVISYKFDRYRAGISYDITLSPLNRANGGAGGPEVTFTYLLPATY